MAIETDTELRIPASGRMDLEKAARYLGEVLGSHSDVCASKHGHRDVRDGGTDHQPGRGLH